MIENEEQLQYFKDYLFEKQTETAYVSDEQRILDGGFNGYTAKPIHLQMLKSPMINLLKKTANLYVAPFHRL